MSAGKFRCNVKEMREIESGKVYNLEVFLRYKGITRSAVREMQLNGLKLRKEGRKTVILGSDYLEYASRLPLSEKKHLELPELNPVENTT